MTKQYIRPAADEGRGRHRQEEVRTSHLSWACALMARLEKGIFLTPLRTDLTKTLHKTFPPCQLPTEPGMVAACQEEPGVALGHLTGRSAGTPHVVGRGRVEEGEQQEIDGF